MDKTLEAIAESVSDAIVIADSGGRIVTWNPAACHIFGYQADEVLDKPLAILIPERYREAHKKGFEHAVRSGKTRSHIRAALLQGLHKDGHEFPIELSLAVWMIGGGQFFGGIIRDVSERERLVQELSHSEKSMRAVMESATDAIICIDGEGCVVHWNVSAEKMLGFSKAEMTGQPLTRIIPERFRKPHEEGVRRLTKGGEPHVIGKTVELAALHKDGQELPIELSLGTWAGDECCYFAGIIRDISDRKQAEAEIRKANQELDEKNQMLEALSLKLAKYLSRPVYKSIFSGAKDVRVESYRKNLTVFFSDIQGFTELTDSMEAEALSEILNQYLREMAIIADHYGGTIDKFIGDGIMIFFGDPETKGDREDAIACVGMALAMRKRINELREEWYNKGVSAQLHVRIGINSGYCTVGNFGSEDRMDYTIVGGQVNAAARLESCAEPDQILISHATYALIKDEIQCRPVGKVTVKGIAYPIKTHEAMAPYHELAPEAQRIFEAGAGFHVTLDPAALTAGTRDLAKQALHKALEALGDHDQGAKEGKENKKI